MTVQGSYVTRVFGPTARHGIAEHFARDGQSLGKVELFLASSGAQAGRNLLESIHGPVAQTDRAAVS